LSAGIDERNGVSPIDKGRAAVKPTGEYPFLSIEVKRFIGEEAVDLLPLDAFGLLTRCIFRAWREGSVPATAADLARLVGSTTNKIERLLPSVSAFYVEDNGRLTFPLVEKERERVTGMLADKSRAGTRSAQKRAEDKKKRAEYRRKLKEQKGVNTCSTGVATGEPHIHTGIHPHPEPSLTTDPKTDPTGATIQYPAAPRGPLAAAVDSAMSNLGIEQESGNGVERYAQSLFYMLWPHGEYSWEAEKDSLVSQMRKYKRGAYEYARVQLLEYRQEGKPFRDGELAYLNGIARKYAQERMQGSAQ
jgi:uncharacterized protein YdaU (DUF1376 family)